MTFWGAVMWFLVGGASASAVWGFFYGRILTRLQAAYLDYRKLNELFKTRMEAFLKDGRLPPTSKQDADALLAESLGALSPSTNTGDRLSAEDEKSADREGLK